MRVDVVFTTTRNGVRVKAASPRGVSWLKTMSLRSHPVFETEEAESLRCEAQDDGLAVREA